jgi:predicted PurR-regulated permease PerM
MANQKSSYNMFKMYFINNKFVLFLIILLLIGLNIVVYKNVSFVFLPIFVLLRTILLPIILSGIAFYLLNPIVDFLQRKRMKRVYSIVLLYFLMAGIFTILIVSVIPFLKEDVLGLLGNIPQYIQEVGEILQQVTEENSWIKHVKLFK